MPDKDECRKFKQKPSNDDAIHVIPHGAGVLVEVNFPI